MYRKRAKKKKIEEHADLHGWKLESLLAGNILCKKIVFSS